MKFAELREIHNQTMFDFAEKFNNSKIAPNVVFILNCAETGLADGVIVDLDMKDNTQNGINNNILSVDWERRQSISSFKPKIRLKQQERKLRDYTDMAIQTNNKANEVAIGFTKDWLKENKEILAMNTYSRNEDGSPKRDKYGNKIGERVIQTPVRYTNQFGVWDMNNIDNLKLFIANALENGQKDCAALAAHNNNTRRSGHLYLRNTERVGYKDKFINLENKKPSQGLLNFANVFNNIDGWNNAQTNIILYPLPVPNDKHDAIFINTDNNTKMAVKFNNINWEDKGQFNEFCIQSFKDTIADALGNGYEASEGFYKDIDEVINANDKNGIYANNKDARELDRIRRYSIKIAEPFQDKTISLNNGFVSNIRNIDMLQQTIIRENSRNINDIISCTIPLSSSRPRRVFNTFNVIQSKDKKKKQKNITHEIKKDNSYLKRQLELIGLREKEGIYRIKFDNQLKENIAER